MREKNFFGRLLLLMVFAGVVLFLYVLYTAKTAFVPVNTDALTNAEIEQHAHLKLPPSASSIKVHMEGGKDMTVWTRFDMDPADEPAFWKSTYCADGPDLPAPAAAGAGTPFQDAIRPWWNPDFAGNFTAREAHHFGYQEILIKHIDPTHDTVYVWWYAM